jgi:ABC-type maltose transport system permease subunit
MYLSSLKLGKNGRKSNWNRTFLSVLLFVLLRAAEKRASQVTFLMVLPVAIVFLFSQRFVTSGALIGSIKD